MIGLYTEAPPKGFAFSDTAFRVFILMASRRLKSDRFFTYDFRPEVYSHEGLAWIADNNMGTVLARNFPELAPHLKGVKNAFRAVAHGQARLIARLRWRARRWFWNRLGLLKYDHNHPDAVPVPVAERPLALVPLASQYRRIPIQRALVADRIPADEHQAVKRAFSRFQAAMYRLLSPQQRGLPPVDADPGVALDVAYTTAHRRRFPPPVRPAALGELEGWESATVRDPTSARSPWRARSPATSPPTADGTFTWDLRVLDEFEYHSGLRPLGSVVTFEAEAGWAPATGDSRPFGSTATPARAPRPTRSGRWRDASR